MVVKGEDVLLFQILDDGVPLEEVKTWLDDAFEGTGSVTGGSHNFNCRQYDPLSFVINLLNFLREDTAPLLAQTSERSNMIDQQFPASASVKERTAGVFMNDGDKPASQRGLFPSTTFDISSADDFPSLPLGEIPRGPRMGNKEKRRIRPTPLSVADKPEEGGFTACGATGNAAPSSGKTGAVGAAHAKFRAHGEQLSLDTAEPTESLAFKGAMDLEEGFARGACGNKLVVEDDDTEADSGASRRGITHLREATSGSSPEPGRLSRPSLLVQGRPQSDADEALRCQSGLISVSCLVESVPDDTNGGEERRGNPSADRVHSQQVSFPAGTATKEAASLGSNSEANTNESLRTPTKPGPAGSSPGASEDGLLPGSCTQRVTTPSTPFAGEECRRRYERPLNTLASLYAHVIVRRFVPSLATEIHLTIRLLHVHSEVARGSSDWTVTTTRSEHRQDHSSGPRNGSGSHVANESKTKVVFKSGRDCRSFAASVLLGLKSLLPHIGADTLDLLSASLALSSQSEELIKAAHQVLCEAKGDGTMTGGHRPRKSGQQSNDDTAIIQSVGAPFAALQWRAEDSLNNFRTTSDRTLFQNRQESVDRFGSLLRDYQSSRKGLQQYPERALQDLRTAACNLIRSLAPGNFAWLARYFLGQLVGWGLAPSEETDSEVMALVAPAGDKGRATLQKLHRRISTPSFGEDGNTLKSSQKLRHPRAKLHADQDGGLQAVRSVRGSNAGAQESRSRRAITRPGHDKGHTPVFSVRIPTAPLQLRWFPGNQEFFYQVLLVLDSYTFNNHLKAELATEIARLYKQQFKSRREDDEQVGESRGVSSSGDAAAGEKVSGFTGTMVKLKVLAKFLGLLTFSPNWGVSAPFAVSTANESPFAPANDKVQQANCPLPLDTYLDHAWSTAGLVGAVPWMADFLRMMKWDEISAQTAFYRHILGKLAQLHAQPCMRPGHPDFTESLFAVSCEVESLFQDLGSDLGVHGFRLSSLPSKALDFGVPYQVPACYMTTDSTSRPGSLDHEVVLSRRLIQNCCPDLEDILTLITNLGRAWKLGPILGGSGTPSRSGQSPRVVGTSGISPRSRRVIKPHPMKPIRVLPSLPEQRQRGEASGQSLATGRRNVHTDSSRLRLVEAFFHSLPDELQLTADFVARRAVQNACEDVLVTFIRPAVAAAISELEPTSNKTDSAGHGSPASNKMIGGRITGEGPIRHSSDQMMAALGKTLTREAGSLAGNRGNTVATATTLSLAPHSLSLRVRQTAAAIAGHHAQQAAEKKMAEYTTTAISEAVIAYNLARTTTQDIATEKHSAEVDVDARIPRSDMLPGQALPLAAEASDLHSLASALAVSAQKMAVKFREGALMKAVDQVRITSTNDAVAVKTVVDETLHLVKVIRFGISCETAHESDLLQSMMPTMVREFLSSLALFYAALPNRHHRVWISIRKSLAFVASLGTALEDLVQLMTYERELCNQSSPHFTAMDAVLELSGHPRDECADEDAFASKRFSSVDAVIRVISWGVVPKLSVENCLLSCLQTAGRAGTECWFEETQHFRRKDHLTAVITDVARGYHSLGAGRDMSTVSLAELLDVSCSSLARLGNLAKPCRYHPMDFCRLVARLMCCTT